MMYLPHQRHSSIMRDRASLNQKEPWPFSFALRPFCSAKPAVVGRYLHATFADSSFGVKTFIEYVVSLGKTIICMTGKPEPVESYFYKNHWYKIDLRKICNYVKPYKID